MTPFIYFLFDWDFQGNQGNISPDGLYHPENAPTYEQFLDDETVLLQFNNNYGVKTDSLENTSDDTDTGEEHVIDLRPSPRHDSIAIYYSEEDNNNFIDDSKENPPLPPPRPKNPPPKFFQKVSSLPVSVPADYPSHVGLKTSSPEKSLKTEDQR